MSGWYNNAAVLALKSLDLSADDIRALLVKSTYVQDKTSVFVADVVASECDATAYVREALAGLAVVGVGAQARFKFTAKDFGAIGGAQNNTIGGVVIFKHVTNDADSPVLAFIACVDAATQLPAITDGAKHIVLTPDAVAGALTATVV